MKQTFLMVIFEGGLSVFFVISKGGFLVEGDSYFTRPGRGQKWIRGDKPF